MHHSWFNALVNVGMKDKKLDEIIELLMYKSELRNPIHNRRIVLLHTRRAGMSHSDYFAVLEEKMSLIEYEKMTADTFLIHLFMQECDVKLASDRNQK